MNNFLKESFNTWYNPLQSIINTPEFNHLGKEINYLYSNKQICPLKEDIFKCFQLCDYNDLKVIILGQDCYHDYINKDTPRATGLSFANNYDTINISPSLRNIWEEIETDIKEGELSLNFNCNLENWARQGVLLLNTALTVEKGKPGSHSKLWSDFTTKVIQLINERFSGVIWCLWGSHARKYKKYINEDFHWILEAGHPSPLNTTMPFKGCKHFSKINDILEISNGEKYKIKWV